MKYFTSALFFYCTACMFGGLILFSLACFFFFKESLDASQILHYYGITMVAGVAVGGLLNYLFHFNAH